jgi:hypothetical protein
MYRSRYAAHPDYSTYTPAGRLKTARKKELDADCIGFDARFPNQNQTKHCWQNYVDYHKCILAKGEDFAPCKQVRSHTNCNITVSRNPKSRVHLD